MTVAAFGEDSCPGDGAGSRTNDCSNSGAVFVHRRGVGGVHNVVAVLKVSGTSGQVSELGLGFGGVAVTRTATHEHVVASAVHDKCGSGGDAMQSHNATWPCAGGTPMTDAGAVFVFRAALGTNVFSQVGYLKSPAPAASQQWGASMRAAGGLVVIGARGGVVWGVVDLSLL